MILSVSAASGRSSLRLGLPTAAWPPGRWVGPGEAAFSQTPQHSASAVFPGQAGSATAHARPTATWALRVEGGRPRLGPSVIGEPHTRPAPFDGSDFVSPLPFRRRDRVCLGGSDRRPGICSTRGICWVRVRMRCEPRAVRLDSLYHGVSLGSLVDGSPKHRFRMHRDQRGHPYRKLPSCSRCLPPSSRCS